jgi:hypothetical protein
MLLAITPITMNAQVDKALDQLEGDWKKKRARTEEFYAQLVERRYRAATRAEYRLLLEELRRAFPLGGLL